MTYVDGFIAPVPAGNREAYFEMAAKFAPIFREHGVIHQVECWGDDLKHGETTDFFRAVKAEEGENVVFSWLVWPSKQARDEGWGKIMQDERMQPGGPMPFDGKRMFFGGFEAVLDTARG
ncbi:MAG: DUF1428 domain-containing protein [Allosphingosinicella sp.]